MGLLAGQTKLRRIVRWCKRNLGELRKHMPFPNGVPSLSTMSRVLAGVDEEMVSLAMMNWIGEISNTRGIHIAIDGKGLRGAARKVQNGKTPYILNAIDVATKLVIGQLAIQEKTNEMATIPEFLDMLEIKGSTVTIDAIGTTGDIMNAICGKGGDFVLQVKENCPALFAELKLLFEGIEKEQETEGKEVKERYGENYSETTKKEKNRGRHEYRKCQSYSADGMEAIQEDRPHVECIGMLRQVRILQVQDNDGNDITPSLADFLKDGSKRQKKSAEEDKKKEPVQWSGLISSRVLSAEELMAYKRNHWAIENSLHYVLDETFQEDKSTIRAGRNTMSVLRKCAYNIVRLLQMEKPKGRENVTDVIEDVCDNLELGFRMIFEPIPSRY